ncbi:zinc ribbon domain-containing protein [Gordonibacter massiliensis (ex Traore et al. 2017)]|uniref:Uncharacterized protein n=1 Tax=Gordonibacter massiliensis (ex Traore et al. 2017) TaxID=1841863 RepID=A0A842JMK1_9ACTN|nr:zinc ribbon domain-containing protein [Gordonibacter massiliensis (ex Traore et al. 2017)]MBC2890369.1 hypothetical protein [Gordonibacter massiliensis (ex Traore et al. 2017)]
MCIPCVMCGACMDGDGTAAADGRCPACGEPVAPDAVSCPKCFTFLYRKPAAPSDRCEADRVDRAQSESGA